MHSRGDEISSSHGAVAERLPRFNWPVPTMLLVGGCLNGFAARLFEAWSASAGSWPLFAISPIEMFAFFVAASAMPANTSRTHASADAGIAEALMLVGLLMPSSTVAWFVTAAYAGYRLLARPQEPRAPLALFLCLALASLWSATLFRWLTIPITTLEAASVAAILGLLRGDIIPTANVVGQVDGHSLVILAQCSVLDGLPRLLVGIFAVAMFLAPVDVRRLLRCALVASLLAVVGNEVRLMLMTWSATTYDVVHGVIGANLYDLLQVLLVLVAGTSAGADRRWADRR